MSAHGGRWHGNDRYFGLHYDLHANERDTELGKRATPARLVPMLRLAGCDFVQTDCKGHPGYTSWHSRVPEASVSPGVRRDALKGWREATRRLGLPLHCHYSGIWDGAAGARHPDWCALDSAGKPIEGKMCPRGPYLERLMVPQMFELMDRCGLDGFWVDGEIWAVEPCYCERCRAAFRQATGIADPPLDTADPHWVTWINFTRESFEEYVTRYCDAIHAHRPGVLVCSNWLQTIKHPGEPKVPTDWISGDNVWTFGLDGCRCEARFISTRGKPWDIMIWAFYKSGGMRDAASPWTSKPVHMIEQEAAVVTALGGNVQVYETAPGLRDGRLVPWRIRRIRDVARFVRARRKLCQGSRTIPQVAVLHSECHVRAQPAKDLMWDVDATPVQGAVYCLLESHYGVDVVDEWALLPRLADFPVVVAPEQDRMSDGMVDALKAYVSRGGRLLVTGAAAFERFGGEFLGVSSRTVERDVTYHVPAADGSVPVFSSSWRLLRCTKARPLGRLGRTPLLDDRFAPGPATAVNRVGKGRAAYAPFGLFRFFERNRYPMVRAFVQQVMEQVAGRLDIRVEGPTCVDVALRRKGARLIVHLMNRASGIPGRPNDGTVDEIPPVGPVTVEVATTARPSRVELAFERAAFGWRYIAGKRGGTVRATVSDVHIHAAIVLS
jgi:hypothetical protein